VVGLVAGTVRIRDRAVLMADGFRMAGQEFPTTTSGFPAALSLMIPSRIGEARQAGGVIRSRWGKRLRQQNLKNGRITSELSKDLGLLPLASCGGPLQDRRQVGQFDSIGWSRKSFADFTKLH
jgi:hypothetical protein